MSDERDTDAEQGDDTAAATRPSGKRGTRRVRGSASSDAADSGAVATLDRPARAKSASRKAAKDKAARRNPFAALLEFLKQVVSELRKVIWPNRKQMVTYTTVVLVFVVFMVAFIYGIDVAFISGVDWLFG
ncbi:preprotein translocase subunit SecE [Nocardia camponoti]|uniref:Protein translocase subunit SecE n=1 Tax=Nocardia camponoti TaxID=1616106 RepID=A0A917QI77_9NOCA|nr:preprotein translocase subunit SecE [Nocardia camponoti]GGK50256.1 protein translocase subunit SecE [Nocardia camponoti]